MNEEFIQCTYTAEEKMSDFEGKQQILCKSNAKSKTNGTEHPVAVAQQSCFKDARKIQRENGTEGISEEEITKNFPKGIKYIQSEIQGDQQTSNKINTKKAQIVI